MAQPAGFTTSPVPPPRRTGSATAVMSPSASTSIAATAPISAEVVNAWIDLKKKDGTIDRLFAHWILGRDAEPHRRRWSILDDVMRRGSS